MILRENRNLTICENEETYWATDSYSLSGHEVRVGDFITNLSKIIFHKKRASIKSFARFEFQIDGNLILYINDKERHSSNTVNNKACHAVFEPKGAISIYDADKKLLNTVREPNEKFGKGVILRIEAEFIHPDGYEYNSKFCLNVIDSQKNDAFWQFDEHTYIAKRGW